MGVYLSRRQWCRENISNYGLAILSKVDILASQAVFDRAFYYMPLNSKFFWWNHWPVSQLPNDGRIAEYPDRPAHSFTSTQDCAPYETTKNSITKIMLCGLTDKKIEELIPLGRSWCKPPELKILAGKFVDNGFDQTQKAYLVNCISSSTMKLTLSSNELSPIVNPAFVIKDWGPATPALKVDGGNVKDFRFGYNHRIDGTDLAIWIKIKSANPINIELSPVK